MASSGFEFLGRQALRYVGGFDSTELAAALGMTSSGVRSRLSRLTAGRRRELDDE